MVCDIRDGVEEEERREEIEEALDRLEKALSSGSAQAVVGREGGIAFKSWSERDRRGMTDLCAYRKLSAKGSWALRQAIAKAEAIAGRKVDQRAVAAGVHSHDGGKTFGKH